MHLQSKEQLQVLQAVADQISFGQIVRVDTVVRDVDNRHGYDARPYLDQLSAEAFVEFRDYKGERHVGLTEKALKVDELDPMM